MVARLINNNTPTKSSVTKIHAINEYISLGSGCLAAPVALTGDLIIIVIRNNNNVFLILVVNAILYFKKK